MRQLPIAICSAIIFLFTIQRLSAQMVGLNAYVKGQHLELAINGLGGFEGVDTAISPVPLGMHFRPGDVGSIPPIYFFGIVANPQLNSWADTTFDGDFFAPGAPVNSWGFEIATSGGDSATNDCSFFQQINGAITSYSQSGGYFSVDWEGDFISNTNLHFKINYLLYDTALFYTTTISITNIFRLRKKVKCFKTAFTTNS